MKFYITKNGHKSLSEKIQDIRYNLLPKVAVEIDKARKLGDLSENAEYHAAKEFQAKLSHELGSLEASLGNAYVVDSVLDPAVVQFGACVKIKNLDSGVIMAFTILGEFEANGEDIISVQAPIAKTVIGLRAGDKFDFRGKAFELLELHYDTKYV